MYWKIIFIYCWRGLCSLNCDECNDVSFICWCISALNHSSLLLRERPCGLNREDGAAASGEVTSSSQSETPRVVADVHHFLRSQSQTFHSSWGGSSLCPRVTFLFLPGRNSILGHQPQVLRPWSAAAAVHNASLRPLRGQRSVWSCTSRLWKHKIACMDEM